MNDSQPQLYVRVPASRHEQGFWMDRKRRQTRSRGLDRLLWDHRRIGLRMPGKSRLLVFLQSLAKRPPTIYRWVVSDNNKLWTTSGVSAGIDGFLALIEHIYGHSDNGRSYADIISDGMEHIRVKDSQDDAFAKQNGVEDVLPRQAS